MKKLFLTLALLTSASSFAQVSLEDLYKAQEKMIISPVEYKGLKIYSHKSGAQASVICKTLGYLRASDFKITRLDETITAYKVGREGNFEKNSYVSRVFDSITCAK